MGRRRARLPVLARLQRGLEAMYRVDTELDVTSFLIDDGARDEAQPGRRASEQLLLRQNGDDDLQVGLFLDRHVIDNLERNDPGRRLDHSNFADFCLAVEGVSHFIYVALCAARERPVSALELELQAEVDKFACCVLLDPRAPDNDGGAAYGAGSADARRLRRRLYDEIAFADDLDADESERYRTANAEARRYAATLDDRFVADNRVGEMLHELRRFYRFALPDKLSHIARVAA